MIPFTWTVICSLSLSSALAAQEAGWSETRFHRVYLRNGYFIDGHLVQDTPTTVVLKVTWGEMSVRKDQIARDEDGKYRVEFMKMRTYNEPAKRVLIRPEERPIPSSPLNGPFNPTAARGEASLSWKELPPPTGTRQEQIAQYIERLKGAPLDKRNSLLDSIKGFGKEGLLYLSSALPSLDEGSITMAAYALSQAKEPETLPILRKLVSDPSPSVRVGVIDAISAFGETQDRRLIRPLLKDSDSLVRATAATALGRLKDRDSFGDITRLLADSDGLVRTQAFGALGLIAAENDLKTDLQQAVSQALESLKGPALLDLVKQVAISRDKSMAPTLIRLLSHDDSLVRANVLSALIDLDARDASEQILRMLPSEREYWPRIQLAAAADKLRLFPSAVDPLLDWLSDPDEKIQQAAARALKGLTGQNLGFNPQAWRDWWEKAKPK